MKALDCLEPQSAERGIVYILRYFFHFESAHLIDLRLLAFYISLVFDIYLDLLEHFFRIVRARRVKRGEQFIIRLRTAQKLGESYSAVDGRCSRETSISFSSLHAWIVVFSGAALLVFGKVIFLHALLDFGVRITTRVTDSDACFFGVGLALLGQFLAALFSK